MELLDRKPESSNIAPFPQPPMEKNTQAPVTQPIVNAASNPPLEKDENDDLPF